MKKSTSIIFNQRCLTDIYTMLIYTKEISVYALDLPVGIRVSWLDGLVNALKEDWLDGMTRDTDEYRLCKAMVSQGTFKQGFQGLWNVNDFVFNGCWDDWC